MSNAVCNKLDDGSEDDMVNIQGKKRLSNAVKKEIAILPSLNTIKFFETVHGRNHFTNKLLI